jgi:predicted DCC family thiol-disulfide oxidoreductase YuxK
MNSLNTTSKSADSTSEAVAPSCLSSADQRFEVFYDGDCPLCEKEIDMIRRMDTRLRLKLTNIADDDFDPTGTGRSLQTLMREIHGRLPDGTFLVGVEVFREIYGRVGFEKSVGFSRWPVVRQILSFGYTLFAWPRYQLAMRRLRRKAKTDEACGKTESSDCDSQDGCSQFKSLAE